ncbi:hypothetical protein [Clostridium sp.]|uniref:hypothetical protein n=1 Tax=Clostridium sp. TaxID=1506 RepID=UPI003D6D7CD4
MENIPYDGFMQKELLVKDQLINASNNDETTTHCSHSCPKCGVGQCELTEGHPGVHKCTEGHTW